MRKKALLSKETQFLLDCRDPFFFIEAMWGKTPQPARPEFVHLLTETDPVKWKAKWFGTPTDRGGGGFTWDWFSFNKSSHLTWQQTAVIQKVKELGESTDPKNFLKQISVASGHGIGKTTLLSMLVLWRLFIHRLAQVACTAPTGVQMHDVLWKELKVWLDKMPKLYSQLYTHTTNYVKIVIAPESWFATAKTARKENPEALAGVHGDHVTYVVDEASGVPQAIFQTAEGAMTGDDILFIMTSNPTNLIGYFYDSHKRHKQYWHNFNFNSEESPVVKEGYVEKMEGKYGRESDNFRVRVLGLFPKEDAMDDKGYVPLFTQSDLDNAYIPDTPTNFQKLGVDPSGQGKDKTAFVGRNSFRAKIIGEEKISTPISIAAKTNTLIEHCGVLPQDVVIDNFGEGANVAQHLAKAGKMVRAVNVGNRSEDVDFVNIRAEAAWRLYEWIKRGGRLVEDPRWEELLNIRYRREQSGKMKLMSKDDMRREGYPSPNFFDGLLLTFIQPEMERVASMQPVSYHQDEDDPSDPY